MSELRGLQLRIDGFRELGAEVMAVVIDPVEENRKVVERLGLDYPILADPDGRAIRAFGLLHAGANPMVEGADMARPATYVFADGRARWRDITENYRVRPGADQVLEAVREAVADAS